MGNSLGIDQNKVNELFSRLSKREGLLPVKVPPFYLKKVQEEMSALGHNLGPLHRAVYPSMDRMTQRTDGEVPDFVDDRANMPPELRGFAIRKYHERMLLLVTDRCLGHCQYCFRTSVLSEKHDSGKSSALLDMLPHLATYLSSHKEVREVILSGGDPMSLPFSDLERILLSIRAQGVPHIRVHTRALAFAPQAFSDDKIALFSKFDVRIVSHFSHPYEICEEVGRVVDRLRASRVRLYNQFPVLRNINDHPAVIAKLLELLDAHSIRNLSVFIPDPINFSTAFRIRIERLFAMVRELNHSTPSWINSTRFVVDTHYGKVRREDFVGYDARGNAKFERDGHVVAYPDISELDDVPGDLRTILWKDYQ